MVAVNNLNKIRSLLIERQLARDESKDAEIGTLLSGVFDELASLDYETGKDIRARLLTINDEFHDLLFALLFFALQRQLAVARSLPMVRVPSKLSGSMDREAVSEFLFKLMHAYVPRGAGIRLSSVEIPDTAVPQEYREPLLLLIADMAQFDASYFEWERVDIGSTVISMSVGRQIARMSDRIDIFYAVLGVVIERLNAAQEYQLSRDVGEEILVTSILDAKPEWGYHTLFMAFNGQFSINMALIYANACVATLRRKGNLPDLLFKRFLFSLHRFYRNIKFFKEAESLYEYMRGALSLDPSDLFNVTSTHFSTKIFEKDPSVISDVYEYVTNNREFIFNSGKSVALPVLSTLHNLKLMFASNPGTSMLDDYVPILEAIVGRDDSERLRALTYADSERLKQIFIEMLSNLRRTRSADDMVSEVRQALIVADKMINFSFDKQDIDAFLLAMVLKADYSLVFQDDFSDVERGFVALNSRKHDRQTDFADYDRYADQVRAAMRLESKDRCLWLAESEKQVFSLELSKDGYSSIRKVAAWTTDAMYDWLSQGLGALAFEETKVTRGQVEQYLEEDQFQDLDKVKSAVKFTTVDMMSSLDNLLLVKDMEISAMPHNLILGASNEFISRENPITCLPSAEWYFTTERQNLRRDFTSRIWIPVAGGDYTLNVLWSRLESSIDGLGVEMQSQEVPPEPLSADVNILAAHGARDISAFPAFFTREGAAIIDVDRIVGAGQVLILLVCHSGSMEKDIFRQKILSLVRMMLHKGYQAVIAPFWSLHISIPPLWLPQFLSSLKSRLTVAEAVHKANVHVYDVNKNPGAWACMHLYGNPCLRVE